MKTQINRKDLLYKYQLLADLMDNIPDVIYFKDKKGRLILVNKAHAKGLGLKPEQVVGKTDFDFFPRERAAMMAKDDQYVLRTGKPIIDKIERATRPDGVDNYVSTTKIPRFDKNGRVIGLIGITRDITRRMRFEQIRKEKAALQKKMEALQEVNRIKSELISVVSHELRIPLSIVKEAVMILLDGLAGEINVKQQEFLIRAKENIERQRKIIDDLLDMSRLERGIFKLRHCLVNLNALFRDSSEFFTKLAAEKGVTLEYALPRKDVNIFIDAERINQVISNLVNNAVKFTEQGGKIKVELKILETKVRIGVIDTGVGIAKDDLPKLFNRFIQISKVAGAERKGLGLGLSIAKELVQRHGGEIWAESKLGVGSKFYFTLSRFYTIRVLDKQIVNRINNLLARGITVNLINLLIVNYKEFRERLKIGPKKFFADFENLIENTLHEFSSLSQEKVQVLMSAPPKGEFSIIFPEARERDVIKFCNVLKDRIRRYFVENIKLEDVFIALGLLTYPGRPRFPVAHEPPEYLHINEIYIGAEMRRFRRVNYKADIDILAEGKQETTQTIDISEGGICFMTRLPLKTDALIRVRLRLPKQKEPLDIKGHIAWIKKEEELPEKGKEIYKAGVEFIHLNKKDREVIYKFIKSI